MLWRWHVPLCLHALACKALQASLTSTKLCDLPCREAGVAVDADQGRGGGTGLPVPRLPGERRGYLRQLPGRAGGVPASLGLDGTDCFCV